MDNLWLSTCFLRNIPIWGFKWEEVEDFGSLPLSFPSPLFPSTKHTQNSHFPLLPSETLQPNRALRSLDLLHFSLPREPLHSLSPATILHYSPFVALEYK
ncbi:unnamed protein product [Cuscuta epithymum]|uniref:Uncharacterized protein n=1 Tax=Cuscuta epithymum TaxID=186058 RepID=A0AAV0E836_9ASTE|nr:unnamed protein product [Cuscuta epithymum]